MNVDVSSVVHLKVFFFAENSSSYLRANKKSYMNASKLLATFLNYRLTSSQVRDKREIFKEKLKIVTNRMRSKENVYSRNLRMKVISNICQSTSIEFISTTKIYFEFSCKHFWLNFFIDLSHLRFSFGIAFLHHHFIDVSS